MFPSCILQYKVLFTVFNTQKLSTSSLLLQCEFHHESYIISYVSTPVLFLSSGVMSQWTFLQCSHHVHMGSTREQQQQQSTGLRGHSYTSFEPQVC